MQNKEKFNFKFVLITIPNIHFILVLGRLPRTRMKPPQSNGQAERFVDTFKRVLMKGGGEGTTRQVITNFLKAYRTSGNSTVPERKSPAETVFGRRIHIVFSAMLPPKIVYGHRQNHSI